MSYLDKELVDLNYRSALFSMAHGVDPRDLAEAMEGYALNDELEVAEGIRNAIADYLWCSDKQNCRVKPVVLQEEWYGEEDMDDEGYVDDGYEDLD